MSLLSVRDSGQINSIHLFLEDLINVISYNPFIHTVVVEQQIITMELTKEQSKKQKRIKNKRIVYERVK